MASVKEVIFVFFLVLLWGRCFLQFFCPLKNKWLKDFEYHSWNIIEYDELWNELNEPSKWWNIMKHHWNHHLSICPLESSVFSCVVDPWSFRRSTPRSDLRRMSRERFRGHTSCGRHVLSQSPIISGRCVWDFGYTGDFMIRFDEEKKPSWWFWVKRSYGFPKHPVLKRICSLPWN